MHLAIFHLGYLVFSTVVIPRDWEESIILSLYKVKDKALNGEKYKWHKFTDQVIKVLEHLLLSAFRHMGDIDIIQFSFVIGRGTLYAILLFASCRNSTELSKSRYIAALLILIKLLSELKERFS